MGLGLKTANASVICLGGFIEYTTSSIFYQMDCQWLEKPNQDQRPATTLRLVLNTREERSSARPILYQPNSGLVLTISLACISR
jgi:hypothetical protein